MSEEEAKKIVDTIKKEEFPYALAIAKAYEKLEQENKKINEKNKKIQFENTYTNIVHNAFQTEKKEKRYYENIVTEFEKWLEEEIKKLKQSQQKIINLNISNTSKAIRIREFNLRITTNSICLDKLQELKEGKK